MAENQTADCKIFCQRKRLYSTHKRLFAHFRLLFLKPEVGWAQVEPYEREKIVWEKIECEELFSVNNRTFKEDCCVLCPYQKCQVYFVIFILIFLIFR